MRILVIGGTRFVGRHLVASAVQRGHEVTVLHRGNTCAGAAGVEHLHADRDGDLGVLDSGRWDATIDTCAYWPRQVETLAEALGDRGGRHLLVSTVSVYADLPVPGMAEDGPLKEPLGLDGATPRVTPDTYGRLKIGCEQRASERHGAHLLTVRPTYVIGPHDHTGRFPAWVARAARGGDVLAPGRFGASFQYLDARDLGEFCLTLLEHGRTGPFHATAPSITWERLLDDLLGTLSPDSRTATWVPSTWLAGHDVTPRELPLWTGSDEFEPVFALDPARARAAGLAPRPLTQTIADTWTWLSQPDLADPPTALGLAPEREADLLARWRAEGPPAAAE